LGNAKGANMDLDELLSKDTKFWSAYESRGNIKRHLGDKKGASSEYEKALKACPIPREIEKLKLLKETL
jgi:Tfp pilus assembly protein PilF